MARNTQQYQFLGQTVLNHARFVPVVPYGVEFTADGQPTMEIGSWYRLDMVLRIRPLQDSDFPVRLIDAVGTALTFKCPQMRGADDVLGALTVDGDHDAGDQAIAYSGGAAGRAPTPNRIVKFSGLRGIYQVKADPAPTNASFSVFPPLDDDVPDGRTIAHLDTHASLTYSGVLASDIDMSAVIGAAERMEAYSIRLHELRG